MIYGPWFKRFFKELAKNTHNSMKNRDSTPLLTNLVGIHPRNIHRKFEANPAAWEKKLKKFKP